MMLLENSLGRKISYNVWNLHCQEIIPLKEQFIAFIVPLHFENNSTEILESSEDLERSNIYVALGK